MRLASLDRTGELSRLRVLFGRRDPAVAVLYGRRRCGKSRLLPEALPSRRAIYYIADDREGTLQRAALAAEIARRLPGFERVTYPDRDALLAREIRAPFAQHIAGVWEDLVRRIPPGLRNQAEGNQCA